MIYAQSNGVVTVTAATVDGSGVSGSTDITITGQNIGFLEGSLEQLVVYPNPANHSIQIKGITEQIQYQIFTLHGSLIQSGNADPSERISLQNLASGTYILRANDESGSKSIKLFVTQF